MPLHLLGKKSWNVYNADNVARVRRDEAAAKAAEEAEEQRMQEVDAERRLAILRGEVPPPLPETDDDAQPEKDVQDYPGARSHGASRKKRKRPGEDDTEFEMRLAHERLGHHVSDPSVAGESRRPVSSAPITDRKGHIDLVGHDETARPPREKNKEAEEENRKERQKLEDQYRMRLASAAGKEGISDPWYSRSGAEPTEKPMKDVWGNDDPRRRQRDAQRMTSNDPLAMMRKGASQVRELKQERRRFQEEKDEELRQMRKEQHRTERHKSRHRDRDRSPRQRHSSSRSRHGHSSEHGRERSRSHRDDHHDHRRHHRHRSRSPRRRHE